MHVVHRKAYITNQSEFEVKYMSNPDLIMDIFNGISRPSDSPQKKTKLNSYWLSHGHEIRDDNETWHVVHNIWHLLHDTWHFKCHFRNEFET